MTLTTERAPGREHIPRYTRGFIAIRILQFLLAIICLGLMAYTIALLAFSGNCLMLFTSIVTVGATLYMIVTMSCVPKSYNYWAVLALDIFLTIFWLVSFALLAVQAAWYFAASAWWYGYGTDWYDTDSYDYDYDSYYDDIYSDSYDYDYKRGIEKRDLSGTALTYGAILGAAAGLGALNFLFFLISLIIHSCVTFRHRRAGLHSKPLAAGAATTPSTPHNPNYAPAPQQQPQTYSAPYGQPPMGQAPPQQGYYVPQQQQHYAPAPSHSTPQGSPIVSPGSVSKTSSPQPQPAYAAYQPPHDGSHEVAGYPPQGNPTNQ